MPMRYVDDDACDEKPMKPKRPKTESLRDPRRGKQKQSLPLLGDLHLDLDLSLLAVHNVRLELLDLFQGQLHDGVGFDVVVGP